MKFKLLATVIAASVPMLSVPAHAGAVAYSYMFIDDLSFTNTPTTIGISNQIRTGVAGSNYNGSPASVSTSLVGTAPLDVAVQCTGDCGATTKSFYTGGTGPAWENAENHTQVTTGTLPGLTNYAWGDGLTDGAPLTSSVNQALLTRADAVSKAPSNLGGANATVANGATFTFTPLTTFTTAISVTADAFLQTFITAGTLGSSLASYGWNITITGSDLPPLGFRFAPDELNISYASTNPLGNDFFQTGGAKTYVSGNLTFTQGVVYDFAINQSSNAAITDNNIPEPGSLALMGLGLLGLGAARRRKAKKLV